MTGHHARIAVYWGVLWMFLACGSAQASTQIDLGVVSFDVLIPGAPGAPGVNTFTVGNFTGNPATGGFALPPDFPVLDSLIFQQGLLTLTGPGAPSGPLSLGDLGPGSAQPSALQFPGTATFTSAIFAATLNSAHFLLADGNIFVASSPDLTATLLPAAGSDLSPGTDFALIAVSGTVASVPEPTSSLMMATLLGMLLFYRCRRRS